MGEIGEGKFGDNHQALFSKITSSLANSSLHYTNGKCMESEFMEWW